LARLLFQSYTCLLLLSGLTLLTVDAQVRADFMVASCSTIGAGGGDDYRLAVVSASTFAAQPDPAPSISESKTSPNALVAADPAEFPPPCGLAGSRAASPDTTRTTSGSVLSSLVALLVVYQCEPPIPVVFLSRDPERFPRAPFPTSVFHPPRPESRHSAVGLHG